MGLSAQVSVCLSVCLRTTGVYTRFSVYSLCVSLFCEKKNTQLAVTMYLELSSTVKCLATLSNLSGTGPKLQINV